MLTPKLQMLRRTLERLMRREAVQQLQRVLARTRPADIAFLLAHFTPRERVQLLSACPDDEVRAKVMSAADADLAANVVSLLPPERSAELLHLVPPDDASDILEHLPEDRVEQVLRRLEGADRDQVEDLSRYESSTAGGIMSPRFFALHRDTKASEAIDNLQRHSDELEMVFYIYVVNELEQLLGVVSLRKLVTTRADTTLFDLMSSDVISVTSDEDQEEVAKLASRYGLLAVPVVDQSNKLIGIVTVDDVLDVLREEATEDILRMAGAGDELAVRAGLWRSVVQRAPWLFVAAMGGVLGALVLRRYERLIPAFDLVVLFVPWVMALSGAIALQGATVVGQSLAQGRPAGKLPTLWLRQSAAGGALGLIYGLLGGLFCWALLGVLGVAATVGRPLRVSLVVGGASAAAMALAGAIGALLPAIFGRMRVDPALATGPLGAICAELAGLLLYFAIGRWSL